MSRRFAKLQRIPFREPPTPLMLEAVEAYTYTHYYIINVLLRHGERAAAKLKREYWPLESSRRQAIKRAKEYIEALDEFFGRCSAVTTARVTLYRGVRALTAKDGGFISATAVKRIANGYAGPSGTVGKLRIPPGTPFVVGDLREFEILLNRKTLHH